MKLILAMFVLSLSSCALAQTSVGVQGGAFVSGLGTHPEGGVHVMTTRTSPSGLLGQAATACRWKAISRPLQVDRTSWWTPACCGQWRAAATWPLAWVQG
ncbi:hypothetical protein ACFSC4_24605 [Deinococcus malanensis]|uniref:hypothetical protein n=1 Tax=Deinococcus malanensis TaxID=1706855 RepID=UPI00363C621C